MHEELLIAYEQHIQVSNFTTLSRLDTVESVAYKQLKLI
jgi:hypothetical protein